MARDPWRYQLGQGEIIFGRRTGVWDIVNSAGQVIASTTRILTFSESEAKARSIVQAVNAYEDLLAALDRLLEATGGCNFRDDANYHDDDGPCAGLADPMYEAECAWCQARAAIAKAKQT